MGYLGQMWAMHQNKWCLLYGLVSAVDSLLSKQTSTQFFTLSKCIFFHEYFILIFVGDMYDINKE